MEKGETIGIQLTLQIIRLFNEKQPVEAIAPKVGKSTDFIKKVLQEAGLI